MKRIRRDSTCVALMGRELWESRTFGFCYIGVVVTARQNVVRVVLTLARCGG